MPGGTTSENLEALARAPASSKELLEGQEAAIRAQEVELDADPQSHDAKRRSGRSA